MTTIFEMLRRTSPTTFIFKQTISLLFGDEWHMFMPDVPMGHEHFDVKLPMKQSQYFGPFPESYQELADDDILSLLDYAMRGVRRS